MKSASRFALVAALLLTAGAARAAPPFTFTYSGYLTDSTGAPATAATTLDLQFYDAGTAGTLLGHEYAVGVTPTADGYFSVIVGTGFVSDNIATPTFDALFAFPTFMAVKYGTDASYMTTRVPLTSVPSAMSVAWSGVKGLPAACTSGNVLQGFTAAGAAICVADANTTYTAIAPLVLTSGAFGITQANATTAGYLTAADWNAFNGKVASVGVTTSGGLAISGTGTNPAVGIAACATAGYVMKWNGTSWGCAADANSGGTVTQIATTGGITGGPITGTGTISLDATASPTFAGLTVTGTLALGWEVVSAVATINTFTWTGCADYANGTCYSAPVAATCPVGKRVVGGGCWASNVFRSHISMSYPSGLDTWSCHASADNNTSTVTAYAVCARMGP